MSSVPYFTHTHFGLQVVSLHDDQQHERRGIYGYIAGSDFRTGGALFVPSMSLVPRGVVSPIEVLRPRRARSARDFYLLHADGKRRRGSARLLYVRTYVYRARAS